MTNLETVIVYADGETDDSDAIEKIANGKATGVMLDGKEFPSKGSGRINGNVIPQGRVMIKKTIVIGPGV